MNPIMNNTKWRECITLLASHGVYLQLQLVGEADFPLDYEASNQVLSDIKTADCLFVQRRISYKSIYAIRIAKTLFPTGLPDANVSSLTELKIQLAQLGLLPLSEDDEFIFIHGYTT
ncbi:hypothetical protein GCM10007984_16080 [Shewanella putrefaciens]|uniref:Uncharacterized protein n=3 Tax=Shewanellaceae TaxID=267890 RepID=E6XM21_SHEP2|nr:hypothetical protein JW975_09415 [Shewanella putrefaciens]QYX74576.1 hypothetical protein K3G22_09405 [Shewanella putrefaciens]GGN17941.1 hypothetical protein GCM10007984_16080 [Shewanella putrefaciens]